MSSAFDSIKQGLDEALEFSKGKIGQAIVHKFTPMDVKGVRAKVGMSQNEFASAFGISVSTLRHWERGDRTPQGRRTDHQHRGHRRDARQGHGRAGDQAGPGRHRDPLTAARPGRPRADAQHTFAPASRRPGRPRGTLSTLSPRPRVVPADPGGTLSTRSPRRAVGFSAFPQVRAAGSRRRAPEVC